MRKPVSVRSFFCTWSPAILTVVVMGAVIAMPFIPFVNCHYTINLCISKYGDNWCIAVVTLLVTVMDGLIVWKRTIKDSPIWGRVVAVTIIELAVLSFIFLALVMPNYVYLEFPDSFDSQPRYYFGEVMGGIAKGQGRAFDREKRLIYRGGFDNNMYEGEGREYAYDCEHNFRKEWWESRNLMYKGEFTKGRFHGRGVYYGPDKRSDGTFCNGMSNGYTDHWYIDKDTGEIFQYKGSYCDGLVHGYGIILREDGTVYQEGWYENGKYYGPEQSVSSDQSNSGP